MTDSLRIVLGQLNFLVGGVQKNTGKIIAAAIKARDELKADLIVFPELALTGYPPEDLLLRPDLHEHVKDGLKTIKQTVEGITLIVGYPEHTSQGIYNAAAIIQDGATIANYRKHHLPNYGVFDEKRYFIRGKEPCLITIKGVKVGLLICEDIWQPGPCAGAVKAGAQAIVIINASPYDRFKFKEREQLIKAKVKQFKVPILYAHCIGGQDEVVFDGGSFVVDKNATVVQHAEFFKETLMPVDLAICEEVEIDKQKPLAPLSEEAHIYDALTLGVKDYVEKNGFNGAVLGLSGGVDSALTLAIAVDALGPDNVEAVLMPSRYTADMSNEDAIALANNLKVNYHIIPIETTFSAFLESLHQPFHEKPMDKTEENIQARCRGTLLMALSNKFGKLVLTTGNKSEMAVGYSTLYGDMAGGFAVLKDVPKTLVYQLCNYRNQIKPDILQRIIDRPPSAELAHDQKDEDTLPPYTILDQILALYVEEDKSIRDIVALGFDHQMVCHIVQLVDKNEFKRRQAPPGIRITRRAFGRERRYPITSGFTHDLC